MLLKPAFSVQIAALNRKVPVPWVAVLIGVCGFISLLVSAWLGSQPHGSLRYGVCKTFLTLHVRFPNHMVINEVKEGPQLVRIEYVEMDAAGQRQTRQIECTYGPNKSGESTIQRITINRATTNLVQREPIKDAQIIKFRQSLPAIIAGEPDLQLPEQLFNIQDGVLPSKEQLLSLQRL